MRTSVIIDNNLICYHHSNDIISYNTDPLNHTLIAYMNMTDIVLTLLANESSHLFKV